MFKTILFFKIIWLALAALALSASATSDDESQAMTNSFNSQINTDGSYIYDFETSNNIRVKADADANNLVNGEYSYKDPQGNDVKVVYKAGTALLFALSNQSALLLIFFLASFFFTWT